MFKSEAITERIMAEISPMIKDFMSETISHSKEIQLDSEEIGQEVYRQMETEVESFWSGEMEIKPERTPVRLYITADGTGVRTEEGPKEAKIGSVYETLVAQGALANDIQYIGGFTKVEDFGKKLYVLSAKRGYGKSL